MSFSRCRNKMSSVRRARGNKGTSPRAYTPRSLFFASRSGPRLSFWFALCSFCEMTSPPDRNAQYPHFIREGDESSQHGICHCLTRRTESYKQAKIKIQTTPPRSYLQTIRLNAIFLLTSSTSFPSYPCYPFRSLSSYDLPPISILSTLPKARSTIRRPHRKPVQS